MTFYPYVGRSHPGAFQAFLDAFDLERRIDGFLWSLSDPTGPFCSMSAPTTALSQRDTPLAAIRLEPTNSGEVAGHARRPQRAKELRTPPQGT